MSIRFSAMAQFQNESFPYTTFPMFEASAAELRLASGVEAVFYTPEVLVTHVEQYENFSIQEQNWIDQSIQVMISNPIMMNASIDDFIMDSVQPTIVDIYTNRTYISSTAVDNGTGPYYPISYFSPPPYSRQTININLPSSAYALLRHTYDAVRQTREGLYTMITDFSLLTDQAVSKQRHNAFHNQLVNWDVVQETDADENNSLVADAFLLPHCIYIAPVFDQLNNRWENDVVGYLLAVVPWDRYMINLLPQGLYAYPLFFLCTKRTNDAYVLRGCFNPAAHRFLYQFVSRFSCTAQLWHSLSSDVSNITVVLRNTCGQAYTYTIDGTSVSASAIF
jgi:hypothetical protein